MEPRSSPCAATDQVIKIPELSPNLKAEFNPGENDECPCVSPNDKKPSSFYSVQYFNKWRRAAIAVTAASLAFSFILAALDFFSTVEFSSSSVLASACDTLLAVVGCIIVLWRFRDDESGDKAIQRESLGSLLFGAAFTVNGAVTITVAIYHLVNEHVVTGTSFLVPLFGVGFCVYGVLAAAEFYISRELRSSVLAALCFDDALTACLHLGLLTGTLISKHLPSLWYSDHYTAIGVSFVIFCCGIKVLVDVLIFKGLPFQNLFA